MKIKITVKTNAGKSEILEFGKEKKAYRVLVKAQPTEGKANKEILKLLRKKYKKSVRIISGLKAKEKIIEIS